MKVWGLALPLHPEFRTLPMLFYVPPLLPGAASSEGGACELAPDLFSSGESARLPTRYLAQLLAGGNEEPVLAAYRKLYAGRLYLRAKTVGDVAAETVTRALQEADTTPAELEAIYRLTSLASFDEEDSRSPPSSGNRRSKPSRTRRHAARKPGRDGSGRRSGDGSRGRIGTAPAAVREPSRLSGSRHPGIRRGARRGRHPGAVRRVTAPARLP